ncbi:MAG: hypothetical protein OSJ59_13640 [Lachnospiraceae bacterium]|nr:hypothetical protein [Lachnospiraceae bacterium]
MERVWTVTDSMGNMHQIMFKKGFGGAKCIVDGDTYKMKSKNWVIWMADHQISIPGAECNLVVIGNKIRLAVNGTYLEDGTPYEPIRNIPTWLNVLVGINAVIAVFMFGMIGLAIAVLLDLLTYKLSLSQKNSIALVIQIVLLVVVLGGGIAILTAA